MLSTIENEGSLESFESSRGSLISMEFSVMLATSSIFVANSVDGPLSSDVDCCGATGKSNAVGT